MLKEYNCKTDVAEFKWIDINTWMILLDHIIYYGDLTHYFLICETKIIK